MMQSVVEEIKKEGLPEEGADKTILLKIIEESDDDYFIHSVLTYARCLKRALVKI